MKRLLLISLVIALLMLGAALPALAEGNGPAEGRTCGQLFGEHHSEHAQSGHLGQDHNPGMHQGLANFTEHDEHEDICP